MKKAQVELPSLAELSAAKLKARCTRKAGAASYELAPVGELILSEIRYVITTGIKPFDDIVGGFPLGRVTEVWGMESCGKSALAIRTAVRAENLHIYEIIKDPETQIASYRLLSPEEAEVDVIYIDNENSTSSAQKLIVDGVPARFKAGTADTVEMIFKIVETQVDAIVERTAALEKAGIDKKLFGLVVVDTIASTSSRQEMEAEWGKDDYARQPQQLSMAFRKMIRRLNKHNVALVCNNQSRDNVGKAATKKKGFSSGPREDELTAFGGKPLKYYATHRVFMWQVGKYKFNPTSRFPGGLLIGFKTTKNRIRVPYREGRMVLALSETCGGLRDDFSVLETLIYLKCAEVQNKEKGTDIQFKFSKFKVSTTTFSGVASESLESQDEKPMAKRKSRRDPSIAIRADWPEFYAAHKEDIDKLWDAALEMMFTADSQEAKSDDEDADEDARAAEDGSEDDYEEQ